MVKPSFQIAKCLAFVFVLIGLSAGGNRLLRIVHAASPNKTLRESPKRLVELGTMDAGSLYAVTIALKDPSQLHSEERVRVEIADAAGMVAAKWLHTADLDFYLTLRPRARGPATVALRVENGAALPEIETVLHRIPAGPHEPAVIAAAPNHTWQSAQPFEFGQTIFGADDERPYAPAPGEDRYAAMVSGFQWFRFTFRGAEPRLAYFVLDVTDREVPLDVDIYRSGKDAAGQPDVVPYKDGESVYKIEATQNYPGLYKFRTRILRPGESYYVRVDANHPAYQLRTVNYPIPPYKDPRQAVRTGMDFLINMGDTWLSNTPRRGAVALRTTMPHADTNLCIACHPTQFTTRGYLTAIAHGTPDAAAGTRVPDRPSLQQSATTLWPTWNRLGAGDLFRSHGGEPPAGDRRSLRTECHSRSSATQL